VALSLDGKTFTEATMVIALEVTIEGRRRSVGFVETDTENERVLSAFSRSLVGCGLDISPGILVIIDGGKGLRAAVRRVFSSRVLARRAHESRPRGPAQTACPRSRQQLERPGPGETGRLTTTNQEAMLPIIYRRIRT